MRVAGAQLNTAAAQLRLALNVLAHADANSRAAVRATLVRILEIGGTPLNGATLRADLARRCRARAKPLVVALAGPQFLVSPRAAAGPAQAVPSPRAFDYQPAPRLRKLTADGRLERVTGKLIQDPNALLDYEIDFIAALGAGEVLDSHSVSATQGSVSLTARDVSRVAAWFGGGTSGTVVALRFSATTSAGRTFVATLRVQIGPEVVSTN